jgi:lysozyme
MNLDLLAEEIAHDEGFVAYPYDDANDARLKAGYTVQGTATFGHGFTWIAEDESRAVLRMRVPSLSDDLLARLPWMAGLSDARQRAIANMAYNLGTDGLLSFTTFLSLMEAGQFAQAADDLARTRWHQETGQRAIRIEGQIRNG